MGSRLLYLVISNISLEIEIPGSGLSISLQVTDHISGYFILFLLISPFFSRSLVPPLKIPVLFCTCVTQTFRSDPLDPYILWFGWQEHDLNSPFTKFPLLLL